MTDREVQDRLMQALAGVFIGGLLLTLAPGLAKLIGVVIILLSLWHAASVQEEAKRRVKEMIDEF